MYPAGFAVYIRTCLSPHISMHSITSYSNEVHRLPVVRLWETVFDYKTAHNTPTLAIDKKLEVEDDLFFIALLEGEIVGTIVAGYDGRRGWLYSVVVHPSYQHKGIGSALVCHAEQALTKIGCMKINLQIMSGNESVVGFYESLGYAVEKRVSMGKRIPENITVK